MPAVSCRQQGAGLRRALIAVVAGDGVGGEHVFHFGAAADVVDDQWAQPVAGAVGDHDADMRQVAGNRPGDQIARAIVCGIGADLQFLTLSGEKHLQIGYPAVVDVGIRGFKTPDSLGRIGCEVFRHVFVDLFLQIDAQSTVGANHHIGTHAQMGRHIAIGVIHFYIGAIVSDRVPGARFGSFGQGVAKRIAVNLGGHQAHYCYKKKEYFPCP